MTPRGITAINAAKTHCPKGHQLSGDNLVASLLKTRGRGCLICKRESDRLSASRRRSANRAAGPSFSNKEQQRFWSNVERSDDDKACWAWTGYKDKLDYGYFCQGGLRIGAHRYALMLHKMPEDTSLWALHSCDNPNCVNPKHLRWGDAFDNMRDASNRGRLSAQKKTHCPAGHLYEGDNLYINPKGERLCRACAKRH